jgi:integrase
VKVGQAGRRRLRRAYTLGEVERLCAATGREGTRVVYRVAAFSGFRRGELRRLRKEDCTPTGPRPRWHVDASRTKNKQPVNLPMSPECAEALAAWWEALPAGGPLCTVPDKDTFLDHQRKAGITRVDERGRHADFHSLRYTFCALLSRKYPIEVVSKLMRHGSLNLTAQIYLDLGLDRQGEGEWVLERLAGPDPTAANRPTAGPTAARTGPSVPAASI